MTAAGEAIIVPDTNVFLEFAFFTDVDWAGLAGAKQAQLVITYPVLHELDKWKRQTGRRRDRAMQVLRRLLVMLQGTAASEKDVRPNVGVVLWPDDPPETLPPDSQDERLLAIAQTIAQRYSDRPVVLVTDDTTVFIKAKARGLNAMQMPEDLRLSPEPSEERRELQRLRTEFEAFKSRSPALALLVDTPNGQSNNITLAIRVPSKPTQAEMQARVEQESAPYSKVLTRLQGEQPMTDSLAGAPCRRPTVAEIEEYRKALVTFQASYREYLEWLHEWSCLRGCSNRLKFVVRNAGRAEAEAVNVIFQFPDDVVLQERFDEPPEQPAAPQEPNLSPFGNIAEMLATFVPPSLDVTSLLPLKGAGPNPNAPRIRRGNSIDLAYGPENVRHGFEWPPDPVWIVLPERVLGPFDVPYVISARNLPEVVEGAIQITPVYEHVGPWLPPEDAEST